MQCVCFIIVGGDDGGLYVWDLHQDTASSNPGGHCTILRQQSVRRTEAVAAVAWSADGTTIVSADKGGVVSFWSLTGL